MQIKCYFNNIKRTFLQSGPISYIHMPLRRPYFHKRFAPAIHGKPRRGRRKSLIHQYAVKSTNPEKPLALLRNLIYAQNRKACKRMEVDRLDPPWVPLPSQKRWTDVMQYVCSVDWEAL